MTTTIKVIPVDIVDGERGGFTDCPHALAIKREFPTARVWVRLDSVSLYIREGDTSIEFRAPLPREAREHIQAIDQHSEKELDKHKEKGTPLRPLRLIQPISYPLHFSKVQE